ncbi:hypothetical protein Fmac_012844 [Flemingia macrophylla]|uniref:ENTH domain-containing protein n=1 Tax=Flemingia macrophylla TaxID=520843 RepID=A0ABD1MRF7_9FABA
MASSTIRKAIGVVKDQTSISIAKVAGNLAPDLEVLVVKATSHDEVPADDKYMREILSLTSHSHSYVNASFVAISKRLSRTRDWIVAVKALMLVHRLLVDGHPAFEEEIVYATRRGTRILSMSDFRDEAHSSSWDHAAFVRVYALYLDQKVEFVAYRRNLIGNAASRGGGEFGEDQSNNNKVTPVREMGAERVLERLKHLLRMLDRVLGCRPSGAAKTNTLVLVALYQVVRDSFKLYVEVCDVLGVLLDRFTEMEYVHCVKAFDSYVSAAKMMDELVGFYGWCKDVGIAGSSEYPEVQRITDKLLGTLEGFLKAMSDRAKSTPERKLEVKVVVHEAEQEMKEAKSLPAPQTKSFVAPSSAVVQHKVVSSQEETRDLVDLRDHGVSADEQGNKLALALFNGAATVRTEGAWEAFPSSNGESEVKSAWETPAAEVGKADWELALVETSSNLSKQKADLAGGFDPLLLNGMYDQGAVRQHVSTSQLSGGSASSVALPLPGKSGTPVLALPAPDGTVQAVGPQDPFAASLSVPPPSYVQIADMEKKQHLLVQEQQVWQQYGRDGMQGQVGLARVAGAPGYYAPQPYGMPQFGGVGQSGAYYQAPYY